MLAFYPQGLIRACRMFASVKLALAVSLFVSLPATAQSPVRTVKLDDCIVSLHDQALIPAQQAGVLVSLMVREGETVSAGQLLGQIDSSQQKLKHNLAEIERQGAADKAKEDIDIRFSQASAAVAETEYQQSLDANRRLNNTIPQPEVRRLKLAAHKTNLQIEKAVSDQHAAELALATRQAEVKLAANEYEKCQITSPIPGEIIERMRRPGEWVNPGEAIARVVRLDVLRVEGFLSTAEHSPIAVKGSPVSVSVALEEGRTEEFTGQITFVSPIVQAGGHYRVWAEVRNRQTKEHWVLQPGMTAQMTIALK
jgi:multidrug efflux pump subunit AcrA (membrane-fusion protein)